MSLQVIALAYHLRYLLHLLRHLLRYGDKLLYPVVILYKAQSLKVLAIVWEVMVGMHRRHSVEALHEQTLAVHIDEAHRTDDSVHTFSCSILLYIIDKSL